MKPILSFSCLRLFVIVYNKLSVASFMSLATKYKIWLDNVLNLQIFLDARDNLLPESHFHAQSLITILSRKRRRHLALKDKRNTTKYIYRTRNKTQCFWLSCRLRKKCRHAVLKDGKSVANPHVKHYLWMQRFLKNSHSSAI